MCIRFDYLLKCILCFYFRMGWQSVYSLSRYSGNAVCHLIVYKHLWEKVYIQKAKSERHKPIKERVKTYQTQWGTWGWGRGKTGEAGRAEIKGWTAGQSGHGGFKSKDTEWSYTHTVCISMMQMFLLLESIDQTFTKDSTHQKLCDWIFLLVWVWKLRRGAGPTLVWHQSSCGHGHRFRIEPPHPTKVTASLETAQESTYTHQWEKVRGRGYTHIYSRD